MATDNDRVALAAFLGSALLAGGNAVAIRIGNRELEPLWGAGFRFTLSAAILLGAMAVLRLPFPRGRVLRGATLYGLINFGLTFAFAYYALTRIHAGLVGGGLLILAGVYVGALRSGVREPAAPTAASDTKP